MLTFDSPRTDCNLCELDTIPQYYCYVHFASLTANCHYLEMATLMKEVRVANLEKCLGFYS